MVSTTDLSQKKSGKPDAMIVLLENRGDTLETVVRTPITTTTALTVLLVSILPPKEDRTALIARPVSTRPHKDSRPVQTVGQASGHPPWAPLLLRLARIVPQGSTILTKVEPLASVAAQGSTSPVQDS